MYPIMPNVFNKIMNNIREKEITEACLILKRYGNDWRDLTWVNWRLVTLARFNAENIIFPDDKNFFKKIDNGLIHETILPPLDLRKYNLEDVKFSDVVFNDKTIFPDDSEFFQKLKNKEIFKCKLPDLDLRRYNLDGINIYGTIFGENTVLPNDKDFFKKLKGSNISKCHMPTKDYSIYDFDGISMLETIFNTESKMPKDKNFLKYVVQSKCWKDDYFIGEFYFPLPLDIIRNINNYNLSGLKISLKHYDNLLKESELQLLRVKYRNEIGHSILLPKKGLLEESSEIVAFNGKVMNIKFIHTRDTNELSL